MRRLFFLLTIQLLALSASGRLSPVAYRPVIDSGIAFSLSQQYTECLRLFGRHSIGEPACVLSPFYRLMTYEAMMIDYESVEWEPVYDSLSRQCETLLRAEIARDKNDAWAHYFLGTLSVTRAAHALRFSHYLNFTAEVVKGIQLLKKAAALDSTLADACLYLGLYQYARAELFSWLPLLGDEKNEAVEEIEKAAAHASFSREVAIQVLVGIYGRNGEFGRAAALAAAFKTRYPDNRAIYWLLGNAYLSKKEYREAKKEFLALRPLLRGIPRQYPYNDVSLDATLARIHFELGETDSCIARCNSVLARSGDDKRIRELQTMTERLRKKAERKKRKGP
ncbi:MAG: hypothetical protein V1913_08365 [Fibrobacterota bacterium]